jgi:hypothetical protein
MNKPRNVENIRLFCCTNNIFKDWINKKDILHCEVLNNNLENSIKLLNATCNDVIKITYRNEHTFNDEDNEPNEQYEGSDNHSGSQIRSFLCDISSCNILTKYIKDIKYISKKKSNNKDFCRVDMYYPKFNIVDQSGNIYNRTLTEQVGIMIFGGFFYKCLGHDIKLKFIFECIDYVVEFNVHVALSKHSDEETTYYKFEKGNKIFVTIE